MNLAMANLSNGMWCVWKSRFKTPQFFLYLEKNIIFNLNPLRLKIKNYVLSASEVAIRATSIFPSVG